jgi:hypothetical protein
VLARRLVAEPLLLTRPFSVPPGAPAKRPPGDCSPTHAGIRERDGVSDAAMCEYQ